MKIVRYRGDATDAQVRWGSNDDPRSHLTAGHFYLVEREEVHSWHTKLYIDGRRYNSANFDEVTVEQVIAAFNTVSGCRRSRPRA